MLFLGIDLGSSSIKLVLFDGESGERIAKSQYPPTEMEILAPQQDWAEQDPMQWEANLEQAIRILKYNYKGTLTDISAIGISYQMHGLVVVDKNGAVLRNAIIWCDSRAVLIGEQAFEAIGRDYCITHLLNSPANFTASKLKWVKDNQPEVYDRIHKVLLPGDFMAYILTGVFATTQSGLSEGIFWDFKDQVLSSKLMDYYGFDSSMFGEVKETFSIQGFLTKKMADRLGLKEGIPVSYRAGDQPNNAFSLNALEPGEMAATAGTSGVIYGVTDKCVSDPLSRVNTFLHVNHSKHNPRLGALLCINGTGISNSWVRHQLLGGNLSYEAMNELADKVKSGSEGLRFFPFGNGSERILNNMNIGASFSGLNFNLHSQGHYLRAMQEGIVFALVYGLGIMDQMGLSLNLIKAGHDNMFLSPVFRQTLADLSSSEIHLYNTSGAEGAARGAAVGVSYYQNEKDAFESLKKTQIVDPKKNPELEDTYQVWVEELQHKIA